MRSALIILLALTVTSMAQDPVATKSTPDEMDSQRSAWGLSEAQFRLVYPSRRPSGDTYVRCPLSLAAAGRRSGRRGLCSPRILSRWA